VPALPHTKTGKKLEVPVKRLLQGAPAEQVLNPAAVDNPDLIAYFAGLGADRRRQPRRHFVRGRRGEEQHVTSSRCQLHRRPRSRQ
ncbi:hypothetical protein, partial [Streptomyces sp. NPDC058206]|uniref:hypothetical protein n=1 Tax=Streptomyces sp. NPDC058206 TaxID=3346382 RepID=UPI0036E13846